MSQGLDVVDFGSRCRPASLKAILAQRVGRDVCVADLAPGRTVAAVDLRVTLEATVMVLMLTGMDGAETVLS